MVFSKKLLTEEHLLTDICKTMVWKQLLVTDYRHKKSLVYEWCLGHPLTEDELMKG